MSITVTKADEVTMVTLTSDPNSDCPLLCQLLRGLCYSPACCSVSRRLRGAAGAPQSVLGALHIMVGSLNVALGAILMTSAGGSWWQMDSTGYPYWMGALFMALGAASILSERFPSPCLVLVNAVLNLSGIALAIAAIVLYAINLNEIYVWNVCQDDTYYYGFREPPAGTELSSAAAMYLNRCLQGRRLTLMLLRAINIMAVVLCVLELCLTISSSVLAVRSLRRHGDGEQDDNRQRSRNEPEGGYKPIAQDGEVVLA